MFPTAALKPGEQIDGFVIRGLLGSGVTSSVYRVREVKTQGHVCSETSLTLCGETLVATRLGFHRMLSLRHPSRCALTAPCVGGFHGFTMDAVLGQRLIEVMNQTRANHRNQVFELAIGLLHDLGGALQAIHNAAGLVHRDVKPENVMIDRHGLAKPAVDYGMVGSYDPSPTPMRDGIIWRAPTGTWPPSHLQADLSSRVRTLRVGLTSCWN